MNDTEIQIKTIVADHFGMKIQDIKTTDKFIDDLGGDSLDTVELMLAIEDKLGIIVDEAAAEEIATVQDVIDYLLK